MPSVSGSLLSCQTWTKESSAPDSSCQGSGGTVGTPRRWQCRGAGWDAGVGHWGGMPGWDFRVGYRGGMQVGMLGRMSAWDARCDSRCDSRCDTGWDTPSPPYLAGERCQVERVDPAGVGAHLGTDPPRSRFPQPDLPVPIARGHDPVPQPHRGAGAAGHRGVCHLLQAVPPSCPTPCGTPGAHPDPGIFPSRVNSSPVLHRQRVPESSAVTKSPAPSCGERRLRGTGQCPQLRDGNPGTALAAGLPHGHQDKLEQLPKR